MAFKMVEQFTCESSFRDRFPHPERYSRTDRFARKTSETDLAIPPMYARSGFAEQFRLLALNVISLIGDSPDRSLAVFSINSGDGRSLVAKNLSLALTAHSDVVLVGNTSLSGVHKQLLEPFELVEDDRALAPKSAASHDLHRLWLLPWADSVGARAERLASMTADAKQEGQFLIVDTPAAESSSDAFLLAQKCNNVLYVMRKGALDMEPHKRAIEQLGRLNARVVGIVVNDN